MMDEVTEVQGLEPKPAEVGDVQGLEPRQSRHEDVPLPAKTAPTPAEVPADDAPPTES